MADEEQVFRFIALRQPAEKAREERPERKRIPYSVTGDEPPLAKAVFALPVDQRIPRTLRRLGREFIESDDYVKDLAALPFDVTPLAVWVEENAGKKLADVDLPAFVQAEYGDQVADVLQSDEFGASALRLAESVFAHAIADGNQARRRDDLVNAIKLLYLVHAAANATELLEEEDTLGMLVARLLVVIPPLDRPQPERREPKTRPPKRSPEDEQVGKIRERLGKVAKAHAELSSALARPDAIHAERSEEIREVQLQGAAGGRMELLEARLERLALRLETPEAPRHELPVAVAAVAALEVPAGPAGVAGVAQPKPKLALAFKAADRLTPQTNAVLEELEIEPRTSDPFATVNVLETELAELSGQLPAVRSARRMIAFGGVMLDAGAFMQTYGVGPLLDWGSLPGDQPCRLVAGIGDLLIVRQKLKAYQLGDFAHIENVLRGEAREREHRRLAVREDITTVEEERETEKERDLQSTERNEMQNEAQKTVESQFALEAGLQVSGSYGPAVSFTASLNASFSTSTSETQRKATSYSREVTEKTSERIRERVREERIRRVLEQVEEINIHRIENTDDPDGHIRGIYRWLNKLYDAQVFNYGQRMMYEFVVPEPAAYFLYAMVANPSQDLELEKPEPPLYGSMPLKPENLTRTNYQGYLAEYEVTSAKAPPPSFQHFAFFEKQEGKEESHYERATKVAIPEGYEATTVTVRYWYVFGNNDAKFKVLVGGVDAAGTVSLGTPRRGEVSVGVHGFYTKAFVVTGDLYCRLTTEGFAKWQHDAYASILEAYLNKKAAYDEALAAREIQQGVKILGRNPLENRRLERDELKKLSIMTLRRSSYLDVDSYYSSAEPAMDLAAACTNGSLIRFFENAFEWNNMTFVHYPYFWGRHARWIEALHLTDPDPDFAAFLKAGATRVQVPVRPGFERAVAYFCQTGIIWEGNDVPLIGDSLYVPIVEEISENLGKLDEGVPYPPGSEPWEVTVPTSLVVVQDLEEIPGIVDVLTGNPISLGAGPRWLVGNSSPRGWWLRHVAGWRRPSSPVFPIRARTGGVPGSVSAIPASAAITDQPSSVPEVELRADFDRDGRLSGSAAEYAARTAGHGAVVGINVDRDGRSIPAAARVERPVQLDHAMPTKTGADGDPIALQVVVSATAVASFASLALRVAGDNAEALALVDGRARVVRPASARPDQVEFALPLRAGRHVFRLEASRVPGSPLGQADGALRLSAVGRDAAGVESTIDESRLLLSRFLVLDDLAPAEALYIASLPDNVPSVRDVTAGLAAVRPAVALRVVAVADSMGDAWVQDQFQLGYMVAPGRTMRAVLHMPRFRTNAQLGANQRNLAELVRTHFPSTDLGLIDDFWQRTVPLRHQGGVTRLSFADSEAAFRVLHRVLSAEGFMREALERLCAAAPDLGVTPAPRECSDVPPPLQTLPSIRLQVPELGRRVEAVVRRLLAEATTSQRPGLESLRDRARRLLRDVTRTLGVSGTQGSEVFELALSGTTFRMDGGDLVDLFDTVSRMHDSLVYGGNIEASPPVAAHPFGKVVVGEGDERLLDTALRELFDSGSEVQPVVAVDTTWLGVGHVDELIAFLPDRTSDGAHVVFRASPEVAAALMDKSSDLYYSGLSIYHPDKSSPWRPLTIQRHRMHEGSHPVTRLFRGKLWLHAHPPVSSAAGEEEGGAEADQDVGEILLPPRVYLRLVDWYRGLLGESLAPFYPDSAEDVHYYRAALTTWDFEFFAGATNEVIVEEKLAELDELLASEFPAFPIRRVPVLFDRAPLADEAPRLGTGATAAFTPNLVNLQFVNGTVLIPNPFGPRMLPADAASVVGDVLRDEGLGGIAGRVSPSYFRRQRLNVTEVWLNPSLHDGRIATPFRSAADLADEFRDGFPGIERDEIERRIRRANRTAFDASGRLRDGWRKIVIPEQTVDLFQAYTHVLLDAQGLRPHWVDSWFYHVRFGEIHCGTNVLRSVPRVRAPWWDRLPPAA